MKLSLATTESRLHCNNELIKYEMKNKNFTTGMKNDNFKCKCSIDARFLVINNKMYVNNLLPTIIQSLQEDA